MKILQVLLLTFLTGSAAAQPPSSDIVLEGELIEGVITTNGKTSRQSMTIFKDGKWSGDVQLWWTGPRMPAEFTAPFTVAVAGDYAISLGMTKSFNYGIFTFSIDDQPFEAGPLDLYSPSVTNSDEHLLGTFPLAAGTHRLRVRLEGTNPKSSGAEFGLDFIRLHPVVKTRAQPGIDAILSAHQADLETRVNGPHLNAVKSLATSYTAALDRAIAASSQAGNLDEAVAIREEKNRVVAGESPPPDDEGAPAALVSLRTTYRAALEKLESTRKLAAAPLVRETDQKLDALQREMTQSGDLEAAVAVRETRQKLSESPQPAPLAATTAIPAGSPAAPVGGLATSPPPPPPRPISMELTMENLAERRFAFGMVRDRKIRPFSVVVFGSNGRLRGNEHPNESAWSVDTAKNAVNIITDTGTISTLCDKVRWENGLVHLSGEFLLNRSETVHAFEEIAPVPPGSEPLTDRRLKGRRFEFCYVSARGTGNDHGVQLADDGRVLGARFPTATTWKVDEEGRLLFFDANNKPFSLFDRFFTFNKGEHLVLEGPMQSDPRTLHRLIELP